MTIVKFMCLLCNRCKFTEKHSHTCNGQFRKHGLKWQKVIYHVKDKS